MLNLPSWLLKLDVMSQIQVDIMQFFLSACIIATLAVLILSQPQEATSWKLALTICIALTTVGMIVAFAPPPFTKYASLFRNWGVLIMLVIAAGIRFHKTESWTLVRVGKYNLVVFAVVGVIVVGMIATPFFTVVNSQEQVQSKQNSIFELVYTAIIEIRGLRADLARDHAERIEQHKRDSTERATINKDVKTIKLDIRQSLVNDSNVKKALGKKANQSAERVALPIPKAKSIQLKGTSGQPGRTVNKISYADSVLRFRNPSPFTIDDDLFVYPTWPGRARPIAKMCEF